MPLAIRHVEFMKYARSYLATSDEPGFDVLSEFWLADPAAAAALASSPSGAILREDADRFVAGNGFRATVEERLVAGAPRGVQMGPARRYALMLTRPPDISHAAFITFVNNWALRLFSGNSLRRVTLDIVRPYDDSIFPADAIVSLWPNENFDDAGLGTAPAVIALAGILPLDVYETPRATLTTAHPQFDELKGRR